jgi:hypothetical protein
MNDQPTCGQGLALNAELPSRVGDIVSAMADILEAHLPALDITDEPSRVEHEAYMDLIRESREAALQLQAIARQMTGYRDLPLGRHFEEAMAAPAMLEAFQRFVRVEQELVTYLQRRIEEDQEMLAAMGALR